MFQSIGYDCCCKKSFDLIWCFLSFSFVPSQRINQGGGREGKKEYISLLKKNGWNLLFLTLLCKTIQVLVCVYTFCSICNSIIAKYMKLDNRRKRVADCNVNKILSAFKPDIETYPCNPSTQEAETVKSVSSRPA